MTLSRRAALLLLAAGAWTLYVWVTRLWIMAGQDESTAFKVVHGLLAVVSVAFGIAIARLGWRALRAARPSPPASDHSTDSDRAAV